MDLMLLTQHANIIIIKSGPLRRNFNTNEIVKPKPPMKDKRNFPPFMSEELSHVLTWASPQEQSSPSTASYNIVVLPGHAFRGHMVRVVSVVVRSTASAKEGCSTEAILTQGAAKGPTLDTHTFTLSHQRRHWWWPGVLCDHITSEAQLLQNPERPSLGSLHSLVVVRPPGKVTILPNSPGTSWSCGLQLELQPSFQRRPGVPQDGCAGVVVEDDANCAVGNAQAAQHSNVFRNAPENLRLTMGPRIQDVVLELTSQGISTIFSKFCQDVTDCQIFQDVRDSQTPICSR